VQSNEEAAFMAAAILSKHKATKKWIDALVPMNVFSLIHDYVKITDIREGTTAIGNVGVIKRWFKPDQYRMQIHYGGWLDVFSPSKFLNKPFSGKQTSPTPTKKPDWMPSGFSAVRLAPNEFMTFQEILMPSYSYFYILAYSIFTQAGAAQIDVTHSTGGKWYSAEGFPKGNNHWHKYASPLKVLANWGNSTKQVRLVVRNVASGEYAVDAEFVTGFIAYDVRKFEAQL